ncbi:efflux RND transporter permease subunit [Mucilaginibacter ginkgonis]|uniref:Multidrug efflux RND transporter permease subunit n=1 Tax=Mucilaginibacter ginkgonis TaxID=2682091 RepID=A0A6I4HX57_9SPHI|nr:multidrug efflux RND transporter permease subunit [Mucilaginibacter ginkgonis]QQL51302.1 multidrug efflux RND transporter permease subunit [Mucilaginibacter ginkgonis]
MIADTFIRRPVTAIVISIVIVVVGLLALNSLPIGQYPEISPPTVQVTATYTGSDALTVEQTVATPVEIQVNGTPGMTYLQSNSTNSGQMNMTVNFEVGTDINIAALDVQNRVGIATPTLPQEVQRLGLTVRKRNPSILMLVAMYSPNGSHAVTFLDNYTNAIVRDALLRAKGVGDVFTRADDFSMRIWLKPDKMAALGLTAADVTGALTEQNVQVAAGTVGAPPAKNNQTFEYTVLTKGRLVKPEEFENVIVRTQPSTGAIVHLKDVARVQLGKFNYSGNSFVDGKRASYLLVYQAPGSNALETAKNVYATMEQLKQSFPAGIDYVVPFESVTVVKVSVKEVVETLLIALLLVTVVVFIFLQSWRATLIPVLAIPVSIIGTFIFFIPLGFTINTLTLFGFVLAIGIVVDDAIVVVEAVQHHIDEDKMSPFDATEAAMAEISAPVIAIALILAAVFVPVGFVPGIVGRLYQQFAITIAISVLISAFVALSLTPALCMLLLKPHEPDKKKNWLDRMFEKFNNWFERTSEKYQNAVDYCIKHSKTVFIVLVVIVGATVFLFMNKPTGFIPTEDDGRVYITYDLPEAASTQRTVEVLQGMMKTLDSIPAIGHYAALGGLNVVSFATKSNSATIFVQLKPWDQREDKQSQLFALVGQLQQRLSRFKDASVVVIPPPAIPGLGSTAGFSFILEEKQAGGDISKFDATLRNFIGEVSKRPEIAKAFSFFTSHTPAYQLTIDREKAKKLGVQISDINNALQVYMGSSFVNDFTIYGRNFHVVAQADTNYRTNIGNIGQYFVRNSAGAMVPLSTLTSYKIIENAPLISHYNLFRSAEVDGNPKEGYSSGDAITALKEVAAKVLPEGFGYEFSGLSREEILSGSKTIYIFALSIAFVFLFLAALYESWSVPFSVLLAVPLGAFGAMLFLTLKPSLTNNVYAQIGLITLIGLAAKNAILIVEFAKERVDKGMEIEQATLEAVRLRLRPIIMTSLAFMLGVLPLLFSSGAGAEARKTIGWTVFGGMLFATSLAIFVVPVLFNGISGLAYSKEKLAELRKKHEEDEKAAEHKARHQYAIVSGEAKEKAKPKDEKESDKKDNISDDDKSK